VLWDQRKIPRRVDRPAWPASSTDPDTWSDYASAIQLVPGPFAAGVGFVLNGDGIACVDLDHCVNADGSVDSWARDVLAFAPRTYVELSPSGSGLHVFGFASVGSGRRLGLVEVYDRARYMTVTGVHFRSAPSRLADMQSFVDALL